MSTSPVTETEQPSSGLPWMHLLRATGCGRLAANAWHKLAPSFPVYRTFYDVRIYMDFRDSLIYWASPRQFVEDGEKFDTVLDGITGNVWDIGANVGVFALYAASRGLQVVAFDQSERALAYLRRSAAHNRLDITLVPQAFSVKPCAYVPPTTANTQNRVEFVDGPGAAQSLGFREAAARFGIPRMIKMDIEYNEEQFLRSMEFKQWIQENRIQLLVELHTEGFWDLVWPDVPHVKLDSSHVYFRP